MNNQLPTRKPTRIKDYDYSETGAYFVTICVNDRKPILSKISVGEGIAPPASTNEPQIKLTPCGEIVKEQLLLIESRYPNVTVKEYVIMPDHIHAVIFIDKNTGGAIPSPTLSDVVCAFKSLTSRQCRQRFGIEKIFQRSFAEHIVRDDVDYKTRLNYILQNPVRWYYKNLKP